MSWSFYNTAGFLKVNTGRELVSTLPSSPVNGQEVFYQSSASGTGGGSTNSMADVGAVWHLRYRAASASTYKWEFVGGGSLGHAIATQETTSSGTYTDVATVGPVVTLPLAGDYEITIGVEVSSSSAAGGGNTSFSVSGAAASTATDTDGIQIITGANANVPESSSTTTQKTGLTAAAVTMRYRFALAGTAKFGKRKISITPIRVG